VSRGSLQESERLDEHLITVSTGPRHSTESFVRRSEGHCSRRTTPLRVGDWIGAEREALRVAHSVMPS